MFIDRFQIKGRLAEWVVLDAASSAELRVQQILEVAIDSWRAKGFDSFDRSENSLTVRLYANCIEALRTSTNFSLFHVTWEAPQPSAEILAGLASPATSARPDLYFSVGRRQLVVEAKRLDGTANLYREYVLEGMKRFWDGRYVSDPAMLFAYLIGPSHTDAVTGINAAVSRVHPVTSADNRCLHGLAMLQFDLSKSTSSYPVGRVLWHYALQV